jgi:hypothetical protein
VKFQICLFFKRSAPLHGFEVCVDVYTYLSLKSARAGASSEALILSVNFLFSCSMSESVNMNLMIV